jgi:hypothetical protein
MKKAHVIIVLIVLLAFPVAGFCESGFGIYGGVLMPQGDMDDVGIDMGFTGGVQWFAPFSANGSASYGIAAGFGMASGDTTLYGVDIETDVTIVEILPTVRYNFAPGQSMGVIVQAGAGLGYINADATGSAYGYSASASDSETEFGFALGGGLQFSQLETLVLYKSFNDTEYFTITLGYNF